MQLVDDGKNVKFGDVLFGKLSPNDRAKLLAPARIKRREQVKELLKDAGVTGREYFNEIDAFDQAPWGDQEFFKFITDLEGRASTLSLSYEKANAGNPMPDIDMACDDDFRLAAGVGGVTITPRDMEVEQAYFKRQRHKQDLLDAGFHGDEFLSRMEMYDQEHDIQADNARPSASAS